MSKPKQVNPGVAAAIEKAGGQHALAQLLNVSQPTVHHYLYENCPPERARDIEKATGISRSQIRPDIFEEEND